VFSRAIVRTPAHNFAAGLTTVDFGVPKFDRVLAQHARYCRALIECGLALIAFEADERHPDSTFVEDTAILTPRGAILTRPGAASREGEAAAIAPAIRAFFPEMLSIEAPGVVDGGDICEAGEHFFIGISQRTNEEGARQLGSHLAKLGYTSSAIDIRSMTSILHLKSGIAFVEDNTMVVMEEMADRDEFRRFDLIRVPQAETYAANCVRVNDRVLVADGFRRTAEALSQRGFNPLILDMSEFRKMDGGLSCLSLRF
jgi:dimethylargininase